MIRTLAIILALLASTFAYAGSTETVFIYKPFAEPEDQLKDALTGVLHSHLVDQAPNNGFKVTNNYKEAKWVLGYAYQNLDVGNFLKDGGFNNYSFGDAFGITIMKARHDKCDTCVDYMYTYVMMDLVMNSDAEKGIFSLANSMENSVKSFYDKFNYMAYTK